MIRFSVLILLSALSPAFGQDQPNLVTDGGGTPGGVARLILSHRLYALGQASKDPLTVLNAARLAASVSLADTQRVADTTEALVGASASSPVGSTEMFATAEALAAENEALLDLIDALRRDAVFAPDTVANSTPSTLAASQTVAWPIPFFGASLAEIGILGNGASNLDLRVVDENGHPVCLDISPGDIAYCSFYPARNGSFLVSVTNTGGAPDRYFLLTN